jgi:hypothetical protein
MENNFNYKGYEIKVTTSKRKAGGFLEGCEMYEVETTQYSIYDNGTLKSFCFDKEDLDRMIDQIERPERYRNMGSRFD